MCFKIWVASFIGSCRIFEKKDHLQDFLTMKWASVPFLTRLSNSPIFDPIKYLDYSCLCKIKSMMWKATFGNLDWNRSDRDLLMAKAPSDSLMVISHWIGLYGTAVQPRLGVGLWLNLVLIWKWVIKKVTIDIGKKMMLSLITKLNINWKQLIAIECRMLSL